MNSPECINGWVEILHCNYTVRDFGKSVPNVSTGNLKTFNENHYTLVGSSLPLCEYYSAFEIYQQFAVPVDSEFNIPRPFRDYDAINLCVDDPKFGRKITTLIVIPKKAQSRTLFKEQRVQYHPDFPHCLVIRKEPFKSMFMLRR